MTDWKTFLASRTVWANIIGLAALLAGALGVDVAPSDQEKAADAVLQIVAGLSFLASTAFRVLATRRLRL